MANVLAFIYDKSIMKGQIFAPSSYRPLNGGIILNNVLAYLASIELECPLLCSVALANLQEATQGVKTFFAELYDAMQILVDGANDDQIPSSEWDLLTPTIFRNNNELENLYKPIRIALQALFDVFQHKPGKFYAVEMMPLREELWLLAYAIYNRLKLSKKFRVEEQPQWENTGLMSMLMEEQMFLVEYGAEAPEGFRFQEPEATWDL